MATGALICPVIPYITDAFPLIELLEPYTNLIWIYGLSIDDRSGRNWQNVEKILNRNFPDLAGRIVPPVFSGEHAFWNELREDLQVLNKKRRLNLNIRL